MEITLQILQITRNECSRILQGSKITELEKHLQMFKERLKEVLELKGKIEETKLGQEGNVEEIENGQVNIKPKFWNINNEIETKRK